MIIVWSALYYALTTSPSSTQYPSELGGLGCPMDSSQPTELETVRLAVVHPTSWPHHPAYM